MLCFGLRRVRRVPKVHSCCSQNDVQRQFRQHLFVLKQSHNQSAHCISTQNIPRMRHTFVPTLAVLERSRAALVPAKLRLFRLVSYASTRRYRATPHSFCSSARTPADAPAALLCRYEGYSQPFHLGTLYHHNHSIGAHLAWPEHSSLSE